MTLFLNIRPERQFHFHRSNSQDKMEILFRRKLPIQTNDLNTWVDCSTIQNYFQALRNSQDLNHKSL